MLAFLIGYALAVLNHASHLQKWVRTATVVSHAIKDQSRQGCVRRHKGILQQQLP
jgi:hypothetical protein